MKLSILIVSYNTRELTLAAIGSVYEQTAGLDFEVIVVENDSSDGSGEAIAAAFPRARLIRLRENIGFARANNVAAEQAQGEYLLLLNPDTLILDRAVEKLVAFAEANPGAGIWGGRTLAGDGSLDPTSCWARQTPWSVLCRAVGLSSLFRGNALFDAESYGSWKRDTVRRVDIVTGCFLLITRGLWDRLGGFDPAFFMYGEEADLCLRAIKLGAQPMITPEATIVHYGGASDRVRADKMVRLLKAKSQLIWRHWRPWLAPYGVAMLKLWSLSRAAAWGVRVAVLPGTPRESAEAWKAIWRRRAEWALDGRGDAGAHRAAP